MSTTPFPSHFPKPFWRSPANDAAHQCGCCGEILGLVTGSPILFLLSNAQDHASVSSSVERMLCHSIDVKTQCWNSVKLLNCSRHEAVVSAHCVPEDWGFTVTHCGARSSWQGGHVQDSVRLSAQTVGVPAMFPLSGQCAAVELQEYVFGPEGYSVGQVQDPLDWKDVGWAWPWRSEMCPL